MSERRERSRQSTQWRARRPPRFPNRTASLLIASAPSAPFEEDEWVGGVLSFGDAHEAPAIGIVNCDERCSMVNFDPDSARQAPEVLRAIVRVRDNKVGVYGTVIRRGRLAVGAPIFFQAASDHREHL